jgi:hypothetical protein
MVYTLTTELLARLERQAADLKRLEAAVGPGKRVICHGRGRVRVEACHR